VGARPARDIRHGCCWSSAEAVDVCRKGQDRMTGSDPREQRLGTPQRVLYVVARDRVDLYESLRASFTESPRLGIVLDRRADRPAEPARDAVAERRRLAVDQALRTRGWARVRIESDGRAVLAERSQ
jgi:hypothetical protein